MANDLFATARQCLTLWPARWATLLCRSNVNETIAVSPTKAPPQTFLLHYPIAVNSNPTTAMLDTGASHSFITRLLVQQLKLSPMRLKTALTATDFGGAKATITEVVTAMVSLADIPREWTMYVCAHAPAPVVLGLDVVLKWPLYLNPSDMCLHLLPPSEEPHSTSERGQNGMSTLSSCLGIDSCVSLPQLPSLTASSIQLTVEDTISVESEVVVPEIQDLDSDTPEEAIREVQSCNVWFCSHASGFQSGEWL